MLNISKNTIKNYINKKDEKEKRNFIKKVFIILIVLVLIIAIIVIAILTSNMKKKLLANSETLPQYAKGFNIDKYNETVEEVRDKSEIRRMKIYLGDIFDNIENKNYDELYARLDDKFKEKLFPKQKVLEDYLEGEIPKGAGYVIKNFERIGSLYVYVVDVVSIKDNKKKIDMKFIFEEYGLNDYKFSFSKI